MTPSTLCARGRPGEGRRVHAGADRVPSWVGQPDSCNQPVLGAQGFLDQAGIDVDEPEFGPAEQPEGAVTRHVTPGQAEVAVGAVAADERPAEIQAVVVAAHGDRDLPARRRSVARYRFGRQPRVAWYDERWPVLTPPAFILAGAGERHVDVLVHLPAGFRRARQAGQVETVHHHGELPDARSRAARRAPGRWRRRVLAVGAPKPAELLD